jgi:membrane protease YdiL (CAAX protease family)
MQSRKRPWKYFLITFSLSWLFWGAIVLLDLEISRMPAPLLFAAAGAIPMLAALGLVYAAPDKSQRAEFWRRLFDLRRVGLPGLAACLLTAPALTMLAGTLDWALGGGGFSVEARFAAGPQAFITSAIFLFFFGPLPEEIGWRGYALDGLQEKMSPLKSSLLLGAAWALWHLPLFFVRGSYQQTLLAQPLLAVLFPFNILSQTFLMTWIFNRTRRSTLSAVLLHYAVNLIGEVLAIPPRAEFLLAVFWAVSALCLVLFSHFNRLPEAG